jgi:hypothetical protein
MSDRADQLRRAVRRFLVASHMKRSDQPNTPYVKIMGPSVDDVEKVLAAARSYLAILEQRLPVFAESGGLTWHVAGEGDELEGWLIPLAALTDQEEE